MATQLLIVPSRLQVLSSKMGRNRDIQTKIDTIATNVRTAAESFKYALSKEGSTVLLQKTLLMTGSADGFSVSYIKNALYAATEAFTATKQLVVCLETDIYSSIELCKRRTVHHESELADMLAKISNIWSEIKSLEATIKIRENEARTLMVKAVKLNDDKEVALKKKKDAETVGLIGSVAGVALAWCTDGASMSLATNAVSSMTDAVKSTEDCAKKANILRSDARRTNKMIEELKSQKRTLMKQRSGLESEMRQVQLKTERLTEAANVLQQVASFLLPTTNAIDVLVQAIQDMDAALKEVALQDNSFEIIHKAFTNQTDVSNGSSKNDIDKLKEKWEELEGILLQNGAQNTDI